MSRPRELPPYPDGTETLPQVWIEAHIEDVFRDAWRRVWYVGIIRYIKELPRKDGT